MNKITETKQLKLIANTIRQDTLRMLTEAGSGHPAGSLGMADIFTALYFNVMNHDPKNPELEERDRFILSNGHICPVLYASLAEAGYFSKDKLITLRKLGSDLQGHPHRGSVSGIENSSGPLGQGISIACGIALVGKRQGSRWQVFCATGDGEHQEGQVWEAIMFAAKYKLGNLTVFIDRNYIQIDGTTEEVMPLDPFADKYRAFGWNVIEIDGHDFNAIINACEESRNSEKPTAIVARTIPGKGVSYMENLPEWHGKTAKKEEAEKALQELADERKRIESE
ncbi:transketolase [Candidatus Micrarchaeota archaeon]|nr:transketolase [Candidatus Micrarchaeota archaeon]